MLPAGHELWLDGGHNAHGAAALARALAEMQAARPAPLVMILGHDEHALARGFSRAVRGQDRGGCWRSTFRARRTRTARS